MDSQVTSNKPDSTGRASHALSVDDFLSVYCRHEMRSATIEHALGEDSS